MRKTIDIPDELYSDIEKLAAKNMRSAKNQIEVILVKAATDEVTVMEEKENTNEGG